MKRKFRSGPLLLLGGLVVLVALFYAGQQAEKTLTERLVAAEPVFARQVGLQTAQPDLQKQLDQSAELLSRYVYPSSTDASQAANDAQQRIRGVFSQAGTEVLSLQVLPPKSGPQFDTIPLTIRVEGDLSQLQAAFLTLKSLAPVVYADGFNLQGGAMAADNGVVKVVRQFELFVLRDQTP